jgi:hypothetical protein
MTLTERLQKVQMEVARKTGSRWDEEQCWRYLREEFPGASDEWLQTLADRIEWAMREHELVEAA